MKLEAFQCPVCLSTHCRREGDLYICESCGNTYTKRQADSQMFIDLRIANSQRQFADFSKAKSMYESIIAKYPEEDLTAAYWGLLLCDQQVMLEVDNNGNLFPSFFKVKENPITQTDQYLTFMNYLKKTSPEKLLDYQDRLNIIEDAREKAAKIIESTKPYDVFICFKKTELNSDIFSTDYDLASEIYSELASKYRVFFSEKSLKGIRVREYEPNIYYGLYTAKVMLLICSHKEYLESHWLQNEWKRFLQLNDSKPGSNKACIIPIFTDGFTPDDLPIELSHMQGLKYGISLMKDIEESLNNIIHPINMDAKQQEEIDENRNNIRKLMEAIYGQQRIEVSKALDDTRRMQVEHMDPALVSVLKLIKVTIEDLGDFEEAGKLIKKAELIDAENYLIWYYKLLVDFQAQSAKELIMHDNFKESINFKVLSKFAKQSGKMDFVDGLVKERDDYLRLSAEKVNTALQNLRINPRPTEEDIEEIHQLYEKLGPASRKYVEDLKEIILNAKKKIRENKISDFNTRLNYVNNKEYPNYDDIIQIQEDYKNLSDDEQELTGDIGKVVGDAAKKMKMTEITRVQNVLTEIEEAEVPTREQLIRAEKMYTNLDDQYKKYVKGFTETLTNGYDKKYKNDANVLNNYFSKLPREKVPSRELYTKLENRYKAIPKKYRISIPNLNLFDEYYDRLVQYEGGSVSTTATPTKAAKVEAPNPVNKPKQTTTSKQVDKKKKKFWLWS